MTWSQQLGTWPGRPEGLRHLHHEKSDWQSIGLRIYLERFKERQFVRQSKKTQKLWRVSEIIPGRSDAIFYWDSLEWRSLEDRFYREISSTSSFQTVYIYKNITTQRLQRESTYKTGYWTVLRVYSTWMWDNTYMVKSYLSVLTFFFFFLILDSVGQAHPLMKDLAAPSESWTLSKW